MSTTVADSAYFVGLNFFAEIVAYDDFVFGVQFGLVGRFCEGLTLFPFSLGIEAFEVSVGVGLDAQMLFWSAAFALILWFALSFAVLRRFGAFATTCGEEIGFLVGTFVAAVFGGFLQLACSVMVVVQSPIEPITVATDAVVVQ